MGKVRTHTFNGRTYRIEEVARIDGVTDVPGEPDELECLILAGDDLKALHSAIHEGGEASDFCDACLHGYDREDGLPRTWDLARFIWRLGYRKVK
jgi:hypothetical protein